MTPVSAVLLDLDGTLIDANDAIVEGVAEVAAGLGLEVPTRDWLMGRIGKPPDETWTAMGADPVEANQIFIDRHAADVRARSRVIDGVVETLTALSDAGLPLAVATTRVARSAEAVLIEKGLRDHFRFILGRDDVPAPKPAPDIIHAAAARLEVEVSACLMVGDTEADVGAARAAGARAWAVLGGIGTEQALREAGADLILSTISDLPRRLHEQAVQRR